jgi:lipoyl(octanoyl) transferase
VKIAHDTLPRAITIRHLGLQDYEPLWRAMQRFTDERDAATGDEIWFTEHPPVFTLGLNTNKEHLLDTGDIPVVQIDRGGQVTYHGPGMLMIYPLIDLKRAGIGVRDLVTALEQGVVNLAAGYGIEATARPDAPGVYVEGTKFASVGLRIRRGSSYHGMALNVAVDLAPFLRINPCGYAGLQMTDLATLGGDSDLDTVCRKFLPHFLEHLGMCDKDLFDVPGELPVFNRD